jgi:hypothetical protein
VLWQLCHLVLPLSIVQVQQHVCAAVIIAHVRIAAVMQTSARVVLVAHVRALLAARLHVATKAAVKLLSSRVAVRRVNVIQNRIDSDFTL